MNKAGALKTEGFTLVELMIALLILTIGLLSVAGLQVTAIKGNRTAQNITSAAFLAEKKLEYFKNLPFASLGPVSNQADPGNPMTETEAAGGPFSRFWTIQSYSGSANMIQIDVTLSWTDNLGSHSKTASTVISK